ncbi:hypothetical protein [Shewanella sp.]|uniref:hypothetical protein n=1 Tax=Shewanella sp. TaxID=50422 RepID=UPI003569A791
MKFLGLMTGCILLSGCATGYQAYTWSGGYKDKVLGEKHYLVEYYGNGTTSIEMLNLFWQTRADELCPNGYDVVDENKGKTDGGIFLGGVTAIDHPWLKAEIQCK